VVVSLLLMAQPSEIPELATELYELSKEYLRQETVEPMKKLGAYAGLGLAGAAAMAVAAIFATLGFHGLMQWLFYEALDLQSPWWRVASRGATVLFAGIGAGLIAWRMGSE
jgi:hypothetical protein